MGAIERSIPVVTCPLCAWARGGLSLLSTPMLAEAFLRQALAEHLQKTHRRAPEQAAPAGPAADAPPAPDVPRRSA